MTRVAKSFLTKSWKFPVLTKNKTGQIKILDIFIILVKKLGCPGKTGRMVTLDKTVLFLLQTTEYILSKLYCISLNTIIFYFFNDHFYKDGEI